MPYQRQSSSSSSNLVEVQNFPRGIHRESEKQLSHQVHESRQQEIGRNINMNDQFNPIALMSGIENLTSNSESATMTQKFVIPKEEEKLIESEDGSSKGYRPQEYI